jgi:hypothetical protein
MTFTRGVYRRTLESADDEAVIYLTRIRLMVESERAVDECARYGEPAPRRACTQLLAEPIRYSLWHGRHEVRMDAVANARRRERQTLTLRAFALEQVHRAALIRYLRDYHVVGEQRAQTLREFHGVVDTRDATVAAHRDYLLAASSQVCATELLELVDDDHGIELVQSYERAYGQFFSMFCEYSRARQAGEPYLLSSLLPEVRAVAARLRARVLANDAGRVPHRTRDGGRASTQALSIQSASLGRSSLRATRRGTLHVPA